MQLCKMLMAVPVEIGLVDMEQLQRLIVTIPALEMLIKYVEGIGEIASTKQVISLWSQEQYVITGISTANGGLINWVGFLSVVWDNYEMVGNSLFNWQSTPFY